MTRFSRIAPLPPREINFSNGVLQWKHPLYHKDRITHYRVYVNDTATLVREVPVGQTVVNDLLAGDRFFVSSYNFPAGVESNLTLLEGPFVPTAIVGGYQLEFV